ncbi:AMP-dependent synthetase and ligase [Segniliparus rotundus DSM 44985]|uniref:Acyl-CoA synthetase n=1 Tax=Segniliparus rotundus (strain ATCC BAA-972 / CDC 1076 / CIP 108378 / DSM 44985 / JCM 13578) TaxID=640132 RepID=D6Z998_SEGRD|nr:AMP-dependent synthetase/ligase [Segniliparus rotundus]ADG98528.1 AMP-dependent synthetase and ligase [Segniliparus rotundus DSM 44985]
MLETRNSTPFFVADSAAVLDVVSERAAQSPGHVFFERRVGGEKHQVTALEFYEQVRKVAKGLVASGVEHGDRVAICAPTRYEWALLDFAVWAAGAVTTSIYETSSSEQVRWIISDSEAKLLVVQDAKLLQAHEAVLATIPTLRETLVFDGDPGAVEQLELRGENVPDSELDSRRAQLGADKLATLIYTSGTTGRPKGVCLTHRNFLSEVIATQEPIKAMAPKQGRANTAMFLPMAHIFARALTITSMSANVLIEFLSSTATLSEDLQKIQPTILFSVPRVYEKVYDSAKKKAAAGGKEGIFERASAVAVAYSEAVENGKPGVVLKLQHALFDRLLYSKLRAAVGGKVVGAVSGGAAISPRLAHFFNGIGVSVYQGYGLTESTAGITFNSPVANRVGSVGKLVAGCSARIADDGEVLLAGPVVFSEYWRNPEATAGAIEDGWFHCGDLGRIDEDGFLYITGRKKDIIVTAGGKNVAPQVLEEVLKEHNLVSQGVVVGDGRPFIAALLTLDPEAAASWAAAHGLAEDTPVSELAQNAELKADLQKAVDQANKHVSNAEAIKKFAVLPEDFSIEGGTLTPTLKVKRDVVSKQNEAAIEALYS